jgi:uncharacterized protein YjiS (DUF1127 family)
MIDRLRRHDETERTAGGEIQWRDRDHYVVRAHAFEDDAHPHDVVGGHRTPLTWGTLLLATLRLWRHRYATRRQLRWLDQRGLADVGIDPIAREREVIKQFWKS